MLYFYTIPFSNSEIILNLFFQTLPAILVYIITIKHCLPTFSSRFLPVIISIPTFILGAFFNFLISIYFGGLMVIHNIFLIDCQFIMMMMLYLIYYRGKIRIQLNLVVITILIILWSSIFEYIRIFLLNYFDQPFFSIFIVNWYLIVFVLFLPTIKKFLNWLDNHSNKSLKNILLISWYILITQLIFQFFVQVSAVSVTDKHFWPAYNPVLFLSSNYIGIPFLKWLAPSTLFIVKPLDNIFPLATFLVVGVMVFVGAFFFLLFLNNYRKEKLKQQERHKFELTQYVSTLESMTQNIRKSHHDFSNILYSLGGYIYQTPINEHELKKYYQAITETFEEDYHHFLEISKLKNLEISELKTLIFTKLMIAEKKGIPFDLEIEQAIHQLPLDDLSLTRICGILIDNALEAAQESENPFVRLALIEDEDCYLFMLVNSMNSENILPLLDQENFSTKGKNRGLGLSIVRELLYKHKKTISLKTTQKNNEFQQTIIFKKETTYGN